MAASLLISLPKLSPFSPLRCSHALRSSPPPFSFSLKSNLSSSRALSSSPLFLRSTTSSSSPPSLAPPKPSIATVFAAKGYKMKTHKASAKRFRVTGTGKIVRRRAGKQHLLAKKNTKRKLRLSKMHPVDKSDYDNVIGALPYLKVNRKAA
ncbi:50S ribosomal protein L35, chloroplastic [Dioscorea cayenensis subsp. rotundata]|uniref:50S ribosomal protein L35 n=1 Tax=Dioscorea cayennensis subsp. rotundata TaxID=55577 RepID=A0AB40BXJ3_DIOCR|nr:50S ribosomal protein L35, chloroplastic [Dioscorea cayenensis subsp. rotundata]